MPIFLDTGNLTEIERFHRMGVIRGVTTNPSILFREGVGGGPQGLEERAHLIAKLVAPHPLSVEVTATARDEVIAQAREFASWGDNVVVKVTVHGPDGELENMEIIHELETRHDIRVNVTAMMSAQQALLAAVAGASYVSIFGGRINDMGYNAVGEITKLRRLLDRLDLGARIIVGSTREVLNVIEWLEAGAHIVTVAPKLLEGMLIHPYTKETVRTFLADGAKLQRRPAG